MVNTQYCTYQEWSQFCYSKKLFCQSLTKTWYSSKTHAENMKNMPSCMPANFTFSLRKEKEYIQNNIYENTISNFIWKNIIPMFPYSYIIKALSSGGAKWA